MAANNHQSSLCNQFNFCSCNSQSKKSSSNYLFFFFCRIWMQLVAISEPITVGVFTSFTVRPSPICPEKQPLQPESSQLNHAAAAVAAAPHVLVVAGLPNCHRSPACSAYPPARHQFHHGLVNLSPSPRFHRRRLTAATKNRPSPARISNLPHLLRCSPPAPSSFSAASARTHRRIYAAPSPCPSCRRQTQSELLSPSLSLSLLP